MVLAPLRKTATRYPYRSLFLLALTFAVTLYAGLWDGLLRLLHTRYTTTPLDGIGRWGALPATSFNFTTAHKPKWLDPPPSSTTIQPLRLRVAIISHPEEVEQRKAFRRYVLPHLPAREVQVDYRFIMGHAGPEFESKVAQEQRMYQDIWLLNMDEGRKRLGEKRWRMLLWAGEEEAGRYDYYMSVDTDAFVRFTALARRLQDRDAAHPTGKSILWAPTGVHSSHFLPSADESHPEEEDEQLIDWHPDKFWYSYPYGYAYLMSSTLVSRLTAPGILLPHHVNYPADDVLVGNWIADWAKGTEMIDDKESFHDALGKTWSPDQQRGVGWDSVVVHKVNAKEMRGLRYRGEFRGEWEGF